MKKLILVFALLNLSSLIYSQQEESKPAELFHIPFVSAGTLNNPTLVLVLHGDAPFNKPSYQYGIAKKIANQNTNVVAVGVLRPGYEDNEGNRSPGERGEATGDNYTRAVLETIHALATQLKNKYTPSKIVLVGHSGGAAISANLIAVYTGFYAHAVLISCPCDVQQWRNHMKTLQPNAPIWDMPVSSLSPIEELKKIDTATQVTVVHGDQDKIVPVGIATSYVDQLKENKITVDFIPLENQGHEIAFSKKIFELMQELLD